MSDTPAIESNSFDMSKLTLKHPFINGYQDPPDLPETKDEDVKQLRSWLRTQPHLPELTDDHLLLFLHSNYFNVKAAQKTITVYFETRRATPEMFRNRGADDPKIRTAWSLHYSALLPQRTPEGYHVFIVKLADPDPRNFDADAWNKAVLVSHDVQISENGLSPGYVMVVDHAGFTFSHFLKMPMKSMPRMMKYMQEGHPVRLKAMHIINTVSFMDKVLTVMRPFIKSAFLDLMHFHGSDITQLYEFVPQDILPSDYGGPGPSMETLHKQYVNLVETKYPKYLEEQESYIMDSWKPPEPRPSYFSSWYKYWTGGNVREETKTGS